MRSSLRCPLFLCIRPFMAPRACPIPLVPRLVWVPQPPYPVCLGPKPCHVLAVGEFRKLAMLADADGHLRQKLQQVGAPQGLGLTIYELLKS